MNHTALGLSVARILGVFDHLIAYGRKARFGEPFLFPLVQQRNFA
jgi:hypothetical protein